MATIKTLKINVETNAPLTAKKIDLISASFKNINKHTTNIKTTNNNIKKMGAHAKSAATHIGQLFNSLKRIATYRLLRSAIKAITDGFSEGIKAMSAYSRSVGGDFAKTMDSLTSQMALLRASLGAMAAPLIQAVAPAIMAVTNVVIQLANAINQLFSMMAGKSGWTKATGAVQQYDDSLKGAGKSQKSLTTGMDELNILSDSSGGGGGSATDASYSFEPQEYADWAKEIKALIDAGDYQGAGSALAKNLNKIIDSWDANAWGKNLGKKIQHGIEFAYGFVKNINTQSLGTKIAQALNGMISEIDFGMLGSTIAESGNRIVDLVYGFVTEFDWAGFGAKCADFIFNAIKDFDVGKAFATISEIIKGLLDTAIGFMEQMDWLELGRTVGQKIDDAVTNIDWFEIIHKAIKLAVEIIIGEKQFLFGEIEQLITSLGEHIENFFETNGFLGGLGIILETIMLEPFRATFQAIDEMCGTDLESSFNDSLTNIGQFFVDAKDWIVETWTTVATWFNDNVITPIVNFFTPILQTIGKIFEGAWLIVRAVWIVVSTWFNETVIQPVINFFEPIVEKIGGFFSDLWDGIVKVWETVSTWFDEHVIQPVIKFFEPIVEKIGDIFNRLWSKVKEGVVAAMNFMIEKVEQALNFVIDRINSLIQGFNNVASWAGEVVGEDWDGIELIQHVTLGRVSAYANGGFVPQGQLFMAREAGPEMVGSIGGTTAVANNDQIVEGISAGVYEAMMAAMSSNGGSTVVNVTIDDNAIGMANQRYVDRRGSYVNFGTFANAY